MAGGEPILRPPRETLYERGLLRRHINVFVNGERGGLETRVDEEDRIDVLPAISGGCAR